MNVRESFRRLRLRRRLRRATSLLHRGKISEADYALIAIDSVERFRHGEPSRGRPALEGRMFDWVEWPIHAWSAIHGADYETDQEDAEDIYGDIDSCSIAVLKAFKHDPDFDVAGGFGLGFRWREGQTEALEDAYRTFYRWRAFDRRLGAIRARYPNTLLLLAWTASIVVAALAGRSFL